MQHINRTYRLLAPAQLVRVSFDPPEEGGKGVAAFECIPCDEVLRWYGTHKLWICPSCEQELHVDEAPWVLRRCGEAFKALQLEVSNKTRRGSRWVALLLWFKKLWPGRHR